MCRRNPCQRITGINHQSVIGSMEPINIMNTNGRRICGMLQTTETLTFISDFNVLED